MYRLLALVLTIFFASSTSANVLKDAWGVITDPLKLASAGNSAVEAVNRAEDALLALKALQRDTDADIRFYLDRLSGLIAELESAIDRRSTAIISRIVDEINAFADRIDRSINSAIVQLECAAEVTLNDTLKRAFGGNIMLITRDKLEIVLPFKKQIGGIFPMTTDDIVEIDLTHVTSPFHIYEIIRDRHLQNIKYANPDSRAKDLVLAYADIARFARFAETGDRPRFLRRNRGQTTVSMLKRQIELTRIGRLFLRSAGFSGPCTAADHRCDLSQETRTAQSEPAVGRIPKRNERVLRDFVGE